MKNNIYICITFSLKLYIMFILKRNGNKEEFNPQKIKNAISLAFDACEVSIPTEEIDELIENITKKIQESEKLLSVEDIQDLVEVGLMQLEYCDVSKAYIIYRAEHALNREMKQNGIFKGIINAENNEVTRENANMNSDSPAGMMMKFASETTKPFVDKELLSKDVREAVNNNYIHIHDKDYYPTRSLTCLQTPLNKILSTGFKSGHGESRGAKRIETAAILAAISMETTQNEQHGGQAIPAFDFYMAPYVKLTFEEELQKAFELIGQPIPVDYTVNEYEYKPINSITCMRDKAWHSAMNATIKRVHQAMESFIHNMNQIHSRGGNQVVFSSINYGTDTSPEGRCVIRELLKSTERGVGNGATAIFPIQIWKCKSGVSINPGDKNYDLYLYSCKVSAKRFFPNYLNLDATYNQHELWDINDPERYKYEVATMGCRTRVFEDRFGEKTSIGRGNLSFTTLNLPKLAIEVSLTEGLNQEGKIAKFYLKVKEYTELIAKQLDERYKFQAQALKKQFPFLMSGLWKGSENLSNEDTVESVLSTGTLGIGFIGLAEALVALTGKHHGESEESQKIGLETIELMRNIAYEMSEKYNHNYSILATPAEGLSGKFTKKDKETFGIIPGVTDREYYTNSNHVPVYYKCSAKKKIEIEAPYHEKTRGGHIFYVEIDGDATENPEAIDDIVKLSIKNNAGYISVNHFQKRCPNCNFESKDKDLNYCPHCGTKMDTLQRITGYLVGTTDRWNPGKLAELNDRIQHTL